MLMGFKKIKPEMLSMIWLLMRLEIQNRFWLVFEGLSQNFLLMIKSIRLFSRKPIRQISLVCHAEKLMECHSDVKLKNLMFDC